MAVARRRRCIGPLPSQQVQCLCEDNTYLDRWGALFVHEPVPWQSWLGRARMTSTLAAQLQAGLRRIHGHGGCSTLSDSLWLEGALASTVVAELIPVGSTSAEQCCFGRVASCPDLLLAESG